MKNYIYLLLALFFISACNSDDDATDNPSGDSDNSQLLLVGNEGGFGQVNASLTSINESTGEATQNVFASANGNATLGDVFQSISEVNGELYFVINNSEKIEVVDAQDFSSNRVIPIAEGSPRYMHHITADKAYVTDLFGGGIHEVNPAAGTYTGFLNTTINTEHIVPVGTEVAVSEAFGSRIEFINPETDELTSLITLSAGLNGIKTGANGNLWAHCAGDESTPAKLYKIDPVAKAKTDSVIFNGSAPYAAVGLAVSPDGTKVYCLGSSVFEIDATEQPLEATSIYENQNATFYSLHVNSVSGDIAVTDVKDYTQQGELILLNSDGSLKEVYPTGIIPNAVHWLGN